MFLDGETNPDFCVGSVQSQGPYEGQEGRCLAEKARGQKQSLGQELPQLAEGLGDGAAARGAGGPEE